MFWKQVRGKVREKYAESLLGWAWGREMGVPSGGKVVSDVLHSRHLKLFHSLSSELGESANDVELVVVEATYKYCVPVALSPYLLPRGDIFLI